MLLAQGGGIEVLDLDYWETPLRFAADNGREGIVGLLLERGALLDVMGRQGWTAFSRPTDGGYDGISINCIYAVVIVTSLPAI